MKKNFYASAAACLMLAASTLTANAEAVVYAADNHASLTGTDRVETLIADQLTVYHDVANGAVTLVEGAQTFDEGAFTKYFNLPKAHVSTVGSEANAIGVKLTGDYTLKIGGVGGAAKEKNIAVWYVKNGNKASYITKDIATATKGNPFTGVVSCKTGASSENPVEVFLGVIGGSAGIHFIKVIPFMTPDLKSAVVTTDVETAQNVEVTGGYFTNNPGVSIYYRWIDPESEPQSVPELVRMEAAVDNEGYTLYDKNNVPIFDPVTTAASTFEYYATDGTDKGEVKQIAFTAKEGITSVVNPVIVEEDDADAPAWDIYGRPVDRNFHGIIIRNGKKEYQH